MTNFLGYLDLYNKRGGTFINVDEDHIEPPRQFIKPSMKSIDREKAIALFEGEYTLKETIFTMDSFRYFATLRDMSMSPESVNTIIKDALLENGISATVKTNKKKGKLIIDITVS